MSKTPRLVGTLLVVATLTVIGAPLRAQPFPTQDLPPQLRPWAKWVLDQVPDHVCPVLDDAAICLWPGKLTLDLRNDGGRFEQAAFADRELFLALPGDRERWPLAVRVDGQAAPVIEHGGAPAVRLAGGNHRIDGSFAWKRLPDSLMVPTRTALVAVSIDGVPVALPQREESGLLWLRRGGERSTTAETLQVQVFRMVSDGIPVFITTRLTLEVSGKAREVQLTGALLEHAVPVALSGDLPAQLDAAGRLRVQVRAGKFGVSVLSRLDGRLEALQAPKSVSPWPERETWVFAANEKLRQVQLAEAAPVDPSRTEMPDEWRKLPAFTLAPGARLAFKQTQRGEPDAAPDRLQLDRSLWLDLSGRAITARDTFSGTVNRTWRLDMAPPGDLGHVSVGNEDQLVTALPGKNSSGVELRQGSVRLTAESRWPRRGALPAVGWAVNVEKLGATLHLPPGWRVFAATGVDTLPGSWISQWTLLGLFFVVLVSIGVGRLFGHRWGALALVALGLAYHETGAPFLTWLSLVAAIALLRAAPQGRLRSVARAWWWVSLVVLVFILIPFFRDQIRAALYPQAVSPYSDRGPTGGVAGIAELPPVHGPSAFTMRVPSAEAPPPPPPPAPSKSQQTLELAAPIEQHAYSGVEGGVPGGGERPEVRGGTGLYDEAAALRKRAADLAETEKKTTSVSISNLAQDPRSVVQTGPGVPNWSWQSYPLSWSGPVSRDHRIRLFLLSPRVNGLLTILHLALLTLLTARVTGITLGSFAFLRKKTVVGAAALLFVLAPQLRAQDQETDRPTAGFPDSNLLEALRERLTRAEACAPACVSTPWLSLTVENDRLSLVAEVHAAAKGIWAIPGPTGTFVPADVKVDGHAAAAIARLEDGFLRLRLERGIHRVEASGPLPRVDSLTLQLKDRPHRAQATSATWEVAGIRQDAPPDESIQLSRRLRSGQRSIAGGSHYSSWLEVDRTIEVGVAWRVLTTVRRVSPSGVPIAVRIPLLTGESLTEGGWETDPRGVALTLNRDQTVASWTSTIPITETLSLVAPQGQAWSEVWRLQCGVVWHCAADGIPPVGRQRDGRFEPEYRPWPGEKLALRFTRPQATQGKTVTVEGARIAVAPGTRLETTTLQLSTRASREEAFGVRIPAGVEVQEVVVGGAVRPIRPEGDRISLSVPPGTQSARVRWHRSAGLSVFYSAPRIEIPSTATNLLTEVTLPEGRWLLAVWGPSWGPAILFWSYFVFVLIVATLLGRVPQSPLSTPQWLLLSLGLTQIPVVAAAIVVGLFFALLWRKRRPLTTAWAFDAGQLVLVVWTLVALGCLYAAVHTGLLLRPDMQVAGNGSSDTVLRWYADQVTGVTPAVRIVSLPLWTYRIVMLAWSLWLAASLVRWVRWGWQCFTESGAWRVLRASTVKLSEDSETTGIGS